MVNLLYKCLPIECILCFSAPKLNIGSIYNNSGMLSLTMSFCDGTKRLKHYLLIMIFEDPEIKVANQWMH